MCYGNVKFAFVSFVLHVCLCVLEVHSFAMCEYCVMYLLCDVCFCMCLMRV